MGLHQKPQGLLNVEGYYKPLLQLFDQAVTEQLLKSELRSKVLEASDPEHLLDLMANYKPPMVTKWIRQDQQT